MHRQGQDALPSNGCHLVLTDIFEFQPRFSLYSFNVQTLFIPKGNGAGPLFDEKGIMKNILHGLGKGSGIEQELNGINFHPILFEFLLNVHGNGRLVLAKGLF